MNNTGNPIGSVSPLDREDNTIIFDRLMLADVAEVPDRLGRPTKTVASFQVFANNVEAVASQAAQDIDEQVTGLQGEIDTRLNNILVAGGRIFDDEAQGRAEVQDGQYFFTASDEASISKILWRRLSSTESALVAQEPSAEILKIVANLLDYVYDADSELPIAFADESGHVAAGFKEDGSLVSGGVETASGGWLGDGSTVNALECVDKSGYFKSFINHEGVLSNKAWGVIYDYEVAHILNYGQSLSLGATSSPALSTESLAGAFMFQGGVQTRLSKTDENFYDSLVPLLEQDDETPCYGICSALLDGSEPLTSELFITADGAGGTSVSDLSRGSEMYDRVLTSIREAKQKFDAQAKSYCVRAIFWTQGERDMVLGTSAEEYKAYLSNLMFELTADSQTLTGQKSDIPVIGYQPATHLLRDDPRAALDIALSQAALADSASNYFVVCPAYIFDYSGDNLHLTNESSRLLGLHYGTALKRVLGGDFQIGLRIDNTEIVGSRTLLLRIKNNVGALALDADQVALNEAFGFEIFDHSGNKIQINDVSIIGTSTIKIRTELDVKPGFMINYANSTDVDGGISGRTSGARGNVRDSQGETVQLNIDETTVRIDNWLLISSQYL